MVEKFKSWFKPPVFPDDEDKTLNAQILHIILASTLVFILLSLLFTLFVFVQKILSSAVILGLLIGVVICYRMTRRGQVLMASRLFVGCIWMILNLTVLLAGRVNTALVSLLLAVTVMAGVLLGQRAAVILSLLSIMVGLGLAILELMSYPLVHYFPVPPLSGWAAWTLALILILIVMNPVLKRYSQTIKALRQSEEKFRTLLDWTYNWELWVSPQGKLIYCSPSCERITGWTPDDFLSNPDLKMQLVHPDNLNAFRRHYELEHDSASGVGRIEYRIIARDGSERWIEHACHPLFGVDHGYLGRRVSNRDITERKQVEDKLREKETQMQALNDNIPSGYTYQLDTGVHGESRRFIYISAGVEKIFGASVQQILDDSTCLTRQFLDEDNKKVAEIEASALAGMSIFRAESRFKRENGQIGWMLLTSTPRRLANNQTVWDGIALDITEQKRAENALRESEEKFFKAFHLGPVGMAITDLAAGKFVDANQSFLDIFEFSRDEAIGHTSVELNIFTTEERQRLAQHQKEQGGVKNLEITAQTKSSRIINLLFSTEFVEINGEASLLSILVDVTKRRQVENALRESQENFRVLAEDSMNGVLVHRAMKPLFINKSFARILGYDTTDEILSMPSVASLIAPYELERMLGYHAARIKGEGAPNQYEYDAVRKDGSIVSVENLVATVVWGGEPAVMAAIVEITDLKRAQEQEREQRRLAEALRDTAEALNSSLKLDDILEKILYAVEHVVPYDAMTVIWIEDDGYLRVLRSQGYKPEQERMLL